MSNIKKILIALRTINKEKDNIKTIKQNGTLKNYLIDNILYKKNLVLNNLINKGHANSIRRGLMINQVTSKNYNEYIVVDEVKFSNFCFHYNKRKATFNKKPEHINTGTPGTTNLTMDFLYALTYVDNYIKRHNLL